MNPEEIEFLIAGWLDGQLTPDQHARLEQALLADLSCAAAAPEPEQSGRLTRLGLDHRDLSLGPSLILMLWCCRWSAAMRL